MKIFFVAIGGAVGASSRFLIAHTTQRFCVSQYWGTLFCNTIGCFIAGYLIGQYGRYWSTQSIYAFFLFTGFLGSFTTLSTLNLETLQLLASKKITFALLYLIASIVLSIMAAVFGIVGLRGTYARFEIFTS